MSAEVVWEGEGLSTWAGAGTCIAGGAGVLPGQGDRTQVAGGGTLPEGGARDGSERTCGFPPRHGEHPELGLLAGTASGLLCWAPG